MFGLLNRIIGNEEPTGPGSFGSNIGGGGGGLMSNRGGPGSGFSLGGSTIAGTGLGNLGLGFQSGPRSSGPSGLPSLNILSPRTPNRGGPSSDEARMPLAPSPAVPEVDMSGLTEEEKALIQSVMMRAQEAEGKKQF